MTAPLTDSPAPGKLGVVLRVGLFAMLGWTMLVLSAALMSFLLGTKEAYFVIGALSSFTAASVANAIVVRIYERGRLSDLGLGWTATSSREFLAGMVAGAGGGLLIMMVPLAAGLATLEPVPNVEHRWAGAVFVGVVLLFGAAGEEMLFHGYGFQLLVRSLGAFATILPASVLFGVAHLGNQNVNVLGVLNTIAWGVLLGYAYLRTGALWLPIGLHFGWNFILPLFGANLSGFTMAVMGYTLRWRVGDLWSGGGYGPEGSLLTTAIVVGLFFLVVRLGPDRGV